jgi:hypothetical protein
MLRGERPFRGERLNTPAPNEPTRRLKYIGNHISQELNQNEQIQTLQQYIDYITNHTQAQNTRMLERSLLNPQWHAGRNNVQLRCVGPVNIPRGYRYSVRKYNYMAWNALVLYARRMLQDHPNLRYRVTGRFRRQEDRIPLPLLPRAPHNAFPAHCP